MNAQEVDFGLYLLGPWRLPSQLQDEHICSAEGSLRQQERMEGKATGEKGAGSRVRSC